MKKKFILLNVLLIILSNIGQTNIAAAKSVNNETVYPNIVNKIGNIGYNIHDVYTVDSFETKGKRMKAKNMFLVVTMSVENYSEKDFKLNLDDFYVNEKEYTKCRKCIVKYSEKATKKLNEKEINKTKIQSQKSYTFTLIFDIKEDVASNRNLKLSIKNSSESKNSKVLDVLIYAPYAINITNIFDNKGMNDITDKVAVLNANEDLFLQVLNYTCGDNARVMYSSDAQAYIIYLLVPNFKMSSVFGEMVSDGEVWSESYDNLVSSFSELYYANKDVTGYSGILEFRDMYNQSIFAIVDGTVYEYFDRPTE